MTENMQSPNAPQPQSPPPTPPADQPMNIYPTSNAAYARAQAQAPARPAWPTVIGIISLCLGGLVVVFTPITLIINSLMTNPAQQQMMESVPAWCQSTQTFSSLLTVVNSIVLCVAGAILLKRRRLGQTLHVVFAILAIVLTVISTTVGLVMISHMQMPGMMPAGTVVGALVALSYPVFLLIWFARAKIKQHVQTWQN